MRGCRGPPRPVGNGRIHDHVGLLNVPHHVSPAHFSPTSTFLILCRSLVLDDARNGARDRSTSLTTTPATLVLA